MLFLALATLVEATETIAPRNFEEPCFTMTAGDRLEYSFTARAPLDFNLHYHEGDDVHYPERLKAVRRHAGHFEAKFDQTYCLMWRNRSSAPITLDYQYKLYPQEVDNASHSGDR